MHSVFCSAAKGRAGARSTIGDRAVRRGRPAHVANAQLAIVPGAIAAWREVSNDDDTEIATRSNLARPDLIAPQEGDGDGRSRGADRRLESHRATVAPAARTTEKVIRVEIAQLETDGPRYRRRVAERRRSRSRRRRRAPDWRSSKRRTRVPATGWRSGDIQTRRLDLAKTTQDKVSIHAEMAQLAETRRNRSGRTTRSPPGTRRSISITRAPPRLRRNASGCSARPAAGTISSSSSRRRAGASTARSAIATPRSRRSRARPTSGKPKLDNPDAAGQRSSRRFLKREPGSGSAALTRLSKIYERAGDCRKEDKQTLEQGAQAEPAGCGCGQACSSGSARSRVVGDHEEETAIQHFQQALRHDGSHVPSINALEKLARDRRDNALLADMLQRRLAAINRRRNGQAADRLSLPRRDCRKAPRAQSPGRNDAALAALARASEAAPDDIRVLGAARGPVLRQ